MILDQELKQKYDALISRGWKSPEGYQGAESILLSPHGRYRLNLASAYRHQFGDK